MNPGATHFFRFLLYLFLAIFAAESQSLLLATAVPIFVAALALSSFANGLWMVNMGYFIRTTSLPDFWRYTFHYIVSSPPPLLALEPLLTSLARAQDYQTFSFDLLVRNDFSGRTLPCGVDAAGACLCPIESSLLATTGECAISGNDVLQVRLSLSLSSLWMLTLHVRDADEPCAPRRTSTSPACRTGSTSACSS